MKRWLLKVFERFNKVTEESFKKVANLEQFDDVFIITNKRVYKAWIMKKTSRLLQIFIWDLKKEVIINIIGQTDSSVILFDKNSYLILNEKDICDYLQ